MMRAMLRVGLTGNIASGKSNAARVFAELGAMIIDADVIAHELMSPGHEIYESVVRAFGPEILNSDLTINRKVLGHIVFAQDDRRMLLNGLVHPAVRAQVELRIAGIRQTNPRAIAIVDAALMVEAGYHRMHDRLVVVTCSPNLQLARLINRDGCTLEEARARIASQLPIEEKLKLADYIIETSGTLRETRGQVDVVYRSLLREERLVHEDPGHPPHGNPAS
jgi:dephospho-CoA kinase